MAKGRAYVQIDLELSADIGVPDAVILTKINDWLCHYEKNSEKYSSKHYKNGRWWIFNTYADWVEELRGTYSRNTIVRTLERLENDGLIITGRFNKMNIDRTKWYSIDYDVLYEKFPYMKEVFSVNTSRITQNGQMGITQNGYMELPKMGKAIPNTSTNKALPNKSSNREFSEQENSSQSIDFSILERQVLSICTELEYDERTTRLISEIICYYYATFYVARGYEHNRLGKSNMQRVIEHLRYCSDEENADTYTSWDLSEHEFEDVQRMIDKFFATEFRQGTNYNILHFTSPGVLIRRYLETKDL